MNKLRLIIPALLVLLLGACSNFLGKDDSVNLDKIINGTNIIYTTNDDDKFENTQDYVTNDISFFNPNTKDVTISWESNNSAIIIDGNKGVVTRYDSDILVTITVTVSANGESKFKKFNLTVIALKEDEEIINIEELLENLNVIYQDSEDENGVTKTITLPSVNEEGYESSWKSNSYAIQVDNETGYVIRSNVDVFVTLEVFVSNETDTISKTTIIKVLAEAPRYINEIASLKYNGPTSNMTEGNNAGIVNLDSDIFIVTSHKFGSDHVGLNQAGTLRLYNPEAGGVTLSVGVTNQFKITKVEFFFGATVAAAQIKMGSQTFDLSAGELSGGLTYDNLDISQFSIKNNNPTNVQIHISEIKITYEALNPTENTIPVFSSIEKDVFSTTIGLPFEMPIITASDDFENHLVVSIQTDLDLTKEGMYQVVYKAQNEKGSIIKTIDIHVFAQGTNLDITIEVDETQIPETIFRNEAFVLPDAIVKDFMGEEIEYVKSHNPFKTAQTGTYKISYSAIDQYGNSAKLEFSIKVIIDPDAVIEYLPYYDGIQGLAGDELVVELNKIISNYTRTTYEQAKVILEVSDRDPNNSANVILVYTGLSVKGPWTSGNDVWTREHIWPQSHLNSATNQADDAHNLKPINQSVNSSRGNNPFVDSEKSTHGHVVGGWYPGDEFIGDVARIVFYMNIMWGLDISLVGTVETLIKWHNLDPVDDFEINRNNVIFSYQKNRNPFIDHPELVGLIWDVE